MFGILRSSAAVIAVTVAVAGPALSQAVVAAPPADAGQASAPVTTAPAAGAVPAPPPVTAAPIAPPAGAGAGAPVGADAAPAPLPPILGELGITQATARPGPKGDLRIEGTLPGGAGFRAAADPQGQLRMLRTSDDNGVLPDDIVRRLVPEPIRNAPIFAEFARLEGVSHSEDGTMLHGVDASGQRVRAMFTEDGALQRFGRGENAGRWMMGKRDGRGPDAGDREDGPRDGHGKGPGREGRRADRPGHDGRGHDGPGRGDDACGPHGRDMRGPQGHRGPGSDGPDDGAMGPRGARGPGDGPDAGPRGDRPQPPEGAPQRGPDGAQPPAAMDDAAVTSILTDGGYSNIGQITRDGPRIQAAAKNPEGEDVWVTINPRGVVVRELGR